jgi:hypothetical protein
MAKFEDPLQENLDFTPDEVGEESKEEQVEAQAPEEQVKAVQEQPELPEKYRGKSFEDVVKMHQESEKLIGKQAREVGEHRKFFDEMTKRELLKNKATDQPVVEEDPNDTFFKEPTAAMDARISNHPAIKDAQEAALMVKAQAALQQLQQQFPDFKETVNTSEFKEWINGSPIRQKLHKQANEGYDLEAASELISTWKAISNVKSNSELQQQITPDSQESRVKSLKAAAVDTGSASIGSKKKYSRKAFQELLIRDPQKYYANADEILLAYEEGRVY